MNKSSKKYENVNFRIHVKVWYQQCKSLKTYTRPHIIYGYIYIQERYKTQYRIHNNFSIGLPQEEENRQNGIDTKESLPLFMLTLQKD